LHWVRDRIARNVFFWDCSRNEFCRLENMQNQLLSDIIIVSKAADSSSYLIFHYFGKTSDLFSLLFCNLNSKIKCVAAAVDNCLRFNSSNVDRFVHTDLCKDDESRTLKIYRRL